MAQFHFVTTITKFKGYAGIGRKVRFLLDVHGRTLVKTLCPNCGRACFRCVGRGIIPASSAKRKVQIFTEAAPFNCPMCFRSGKFTPADVDDHWPKD